MVETARTRGSSGGASHPARGTTECHLDAWTNQSHRHIEYSRPWALRMIEPFEFVVEVKPMS